LTSIKQQLHTKCLEYINERIAAAQEAIQTAQRSANEETKSSAGDKYETGRAMAQLEIEKNTIQLGESKKLKQVLDQISVKRESSVISMGSVVFTNQGNFFIAISAGQFVIETETYFAISPNSPIGQRLMGLHANESLLFNKKEYQISRIL
jgi:transcription elongation GreA/GreB family factor